MATQGTGANAPRKGWRVSKKNKTYVIVDFNDGETWNTIGGCRILTITEKSFDDLCEGRIEVNDIAPISEIVLSKE